VTPTRSPRGRTSTLAFALDLAALLLIAAGVLIELTGGFRIDIAGVQVSAHGGGRAFGAALC
jgi:membrane associated rhomboid family serine protease